MVVLTELTPAGSSSSSSNHHQNYIYDVFLSFRGADTRYSFTDHLYNALLDANIKTFFDDEEIETGEPLKPELESAITSSRASIIVLSKNYASSRWCLDELVLILEQQTRINQIVIPIFYHVEPTDVRKQQSSFMEAMKKHKQRMESETDAEKRSEWAQKMELWKMALTQVGSLKGKVAKGRKETELIEEVVKDIHRRLGVLLSDTPPFLIGMDYEINFISSWLTDGSCHTVIILTFVGIGGIGKTSLAKHVFQLHSAKFHKSSFLENIDKRCKEQFNGLFDLQKQLRKVISRKISLQLDDVSKKVFIVLDDIGSVDQLDDLLGNKGLNPGSKIIITSKNASFTEKCALFNLQVQPKHKKVSLNGLYEYASLELLCIHAFKSHKPKEGYKNVSKELVKYCVGHPLALKVLGSFLHKQDVAYWEDYIKGLKKEPHPDIKKALQMSIEFLPSENDKKLFKHIACFFVGKQRDLIETILNACGIHTKFGIKNLIDRCLLSIDRNDSLVRHSLIQEVGKDLVRQESPDKPWKRSRVWCHEESFKVLKQKKDKGNLLGLALDMRMLDEKKLRGSFELKTDSLSQMDNVMLLQLNYVQLNECFQNFPEELRWLCMHGFPLNSIHLDVPIENLVALDMSYSNIESFDMSCTNWQPPAKRQKLDGLCSKYKRLLGSLKILDLSFCDQLYSVGGFFELPALEKLVVRQCISLIEVCESVEQCVELVHIDLSYCNKLKKLPLSLRKLKKVQTLLLDGCNLCESAIMDSSDLSINSQTSSSAIIMGATPSDFKFFTNFLPSSLRILSLANNKLSNESFPMDFSCLAMLEELCLDGNPIVSLPSCLETLPRIETLSIDYCYDVISVEHLPHTLRVLSMFIDAASKTKKIKFDQEMPPLKLRGFFNMMWRSFLEPRNNLPLWLEFDGIIKIQPMADVEEKLLQSLGWTNLQFIKGHMEAHNVQMIYEFGIFSTFYWWEGIPDWIRCRSEGPSISFIIPSSPKKLQGLNFCCVIQPLDASRVLVLPAIKITNITKNQTWIYYHYSKHITWVDGKNCFSWLSHWMFGANEMKAGDHIKIECTHTLDYKMECGVGVVYDDGSVEEEGEDDDVLGYYKSWNHIIGGDLSGFQATTGEYYLRNMGFARNNGQLTFICSYKEEEVLFKAFSKKKSETLGSQAQMPTTAMAPAGAPLLLENNT